MLKNLNVEDFKEALGTSGTTSERPLNLPAQSSYFNTDTNRPEIFDGVEWKPLLTESDAATYTVASKTSVDPSAFDFASLEDALAWLYDNRYINIVTFNLDDGEHDLIGKTIKFKEKVVFSGSHKDNCTINVINADLKIEDSPVVIFGSLTINTAYYIRFYNTKTTIGLCHLNFTSKGIAFFNGAYCYFYNSDITLVGAQQLSASYATVEMYLGTITAGDIEGIYLRSSFLYLWGGTTITKPVYGTGNGIELNFNSEVRVDNYGSVIINGFNNAVRVKKDSRFYVTGVAPTYTNNNNDLVDDSYGVTASRPTGEEIVKAKGEFFFNEDKNAPEWFDGTNWVSAENNRILATAVTKTVASTTSLNPETFDFQTFHDAMKWVEGLSAGSNLITIELDDGTHYVGDPASFNTANWSYYTIQNKDVSLKSISGNKDACIITMPDIADGGNWPTIFFVYQSVFSFNDVTFSGGDISYINFDPKTVYLVSASGGSKVFLYHATIKTGQVGLELYADSFLGINTWTAGKNTLIDDFDYTAVNIVSGKMVVSRNNASAPISITNSTTGISIRDLSEASIKNLTFAGNTSDTNIPLNEVQYDGSFITDENALTNKYDNTISGLLATTEKTAIDELALKAEGSHLSNSVTKTVGAGKDFETLHLALRWVEDTNQSSGNIVLTLDDGTHILGGQNEFDDFYWTYYKISNKNLFIQSSSGIKANCIITLDPFNDGGNWPGIIDAFHSAIILKAVTVDHTAGGYPYPNTTDFVYLTQSKLYLHTSTIANGNLGAGINEGSMFNLYNSTIDNCATGIMSYSTDVSVFGLTVSNCDIAMASYYGGRILLNNAPVLTNNTSDYNVPLNEIQFDGSFITDGSSLSNKYDNTGTELVATTEAGAITEIGNRVVKTYTTYTVASSTSVDPSAFDFPDLHSALRFIEDKTVVVNGWFELQLDDGVHVLGGQGEFHDWNWCYYTLYNNGITIQSISKVKANCTITLDLFDDADNWPTIFGLIDSTIFLYWVTIDLALDGYPYPENAGFMYLSGASNTYMYDAKYTNMGTAIGSSQYSAAYARNSIFDNCTTAIDMYSGTSKASQCTFTNNTTAISVSDGGSFILKEPANVFTNNTADFSSPLNEIQYDGSYIADVNAPLRRKPLIKAESGLVSYTPDLNLTNHFEYTLTQNAVLNKIVSCTKGQTGTLIIKQDAVGGWTVNFEQYSYEFGYAGNPTIGLEPNNINVFKYTVLEDGVDPSVFIEFVASYNKEVPA